MKLSQRFLSAVLSCAFVGSAVVSPGAFAADDESIETVSSDIYDITEEAESKEENEEEATVEATEAQAEDAVTQVSETEAESTTAAAMDAVLAFAEAAAETPFNVFAIYNAHQGYLDRLKDSANLYRRADGIDVSEWQHEINWQKVKDAGVDFAIIRAGYGKVISQKDPYFETNVEQAQALGIDTGTYWYSYATTVEAAQREAEVCYEVIKNYDFTYPVYFDIEDACQSKLSVAEVSAIIETFCNYIESKGYHVGLYSYVNFLNTKVYSSLLDKYDIWVANFNVDVPNYNSDYGIWQYSDSGHIDGINGVVDLNHAYVNYPFVVSPKTYDPEKYPNTSSEPSYPEVQVNKGIANGIDVSEWQKSIDWNKVKADGVDYAIIRAGYGKLLSQKDVYFDQNMKAAEEAGLGRGVYWYSYATTPAAAKQEAETCLEVIKGYKLEYPVYFDVEDAVIAKLSTAEVTAITDAFCSVLEKEGYFVGITSYTNFLNTKLDSSLFKKYTVWVAHYNVNRPSFNKGYGMWQYTSTGSVNGINGNVDRDYLYTDYPSIIKDVHLNGY